MKMKNLEWLKKNQKNIERKFLIKLIKRKIIKKTKEAESEKKIKSWMKIIK